MQETAFSPLKYLDCLCRIFPVKGAIVVGAGMGDAPWFDLLIQQTVDDVVLVEADKSNVRHLEKKYSSRNQWKVLHQVVSDKEEERLFYRLSNSAESGILEPELLASLWPNISTREVQLCQTVTLDSLILENDVHANWLVIDCLPAISMLNGAKNNLSVFDVVVVRIVIGNDANSQLFDVQQDVDTIMRKHGLVSIGIESELHPSLGHAVYIRDIPHQTMELKRLTTELGLFREEWHEKGLAWEQEKKELQKTHALELGKALEELHQLRQTYEKLQDQVEVMLSVNENLKQTEKRLRNDLKKGLANAVKQVEAFMSIQNYLNSGELLCDFHGWPISPDIGLFLLEKMHEQYYDLIIEFGSGTSTALLAKGVEVMSRRISTDDGTSSVESTEIVSFEHDIHFHAKTKQLLLAYGLDHRVQLVHSPLIDWQEGDRNYLYYDCQAMLSELAQKYAHRQLHILLLVDGPPGSTCTNARYPAVPLVFAFLGRHHIDVVLDDAYRPEEKTVIELWCKYWTERSIHLKQGFVPSEKGIYFGTTL